MKKSLSLILGVLFFVAALKVQAEQLPYLDPSQPTEVRIQDLIGRLTLEDKAAILYHKNPANEKLHMPHWAGWNQCLHGVWTKKPTTLFPVPIAMAATWNPGLIQSMADDISDEARALYNADADGLGGKHGLVYRAPVINISRDPRWGRIQECYGEDSYLTGRIGVAYIHGLQGNDPKYLKVAATLKHYAVNNQEKDRLTLSATVPERMLYEFWLPHFKTCIVEGQAQSIMAAYNAINGTPCAMNKLLLTDILRDKWGFQGFVVSDLDGIRHLIKDRHLTAKPEEAVAWALQAGCDYDDEDYRDAIPAAVRQGLVSEEVVNRALTRVLRVAFRLGAFDPPDQIPYSKITTDVIDSSAHRDKALQVARESIVLLSNRSAFLPLDRTKLKSLAVIGPAAQKPETGNYFGAKPRCISPLDGLKDRLGAGVEVRFAPGCGMLEPANPVEIDQAVEAARGSDVAILFLGTNLKVEAEGRDRGSLNLPGAQEQLLEAVVKANPKTVVVLMNAGPLGVGWAKDNVPAMVEAWYAGEEGGHAIADVLLGDFNPGAKLPYTMYASTDDLPPQDEYDVTKGFTYLYYQGKPLFPFGHGLSYTTFDYDSLQLRQSRIHSQESLSVTASVRNSGKVAGDEVVQLYIHQEKCSVKQPIKKLAAFQKVHLEPGEKKTVELTIKPDSLAIYDVTKHDFVVEPGAFDIMIGASSEDVRLRDKVEVVP